MTQVRLTVNGVERLVSSPRGTPLLWILRDELKLTGTKYGCGVGACGACTVHVDGQAMRACVVPVDTLEGRNLTTIEGLGGDSKGLHPVQAAWIAEQVAQCGYCQSGMIMAAAALLAATPDPTAAEIEAAMTNICRCGTYVRVRRAIHRAASRASKATTGA